MSRTESTVVLPILGHLENIQAETCTDFILLLLDIFGDYPSKELLTGVCIDRACDVHPYVKRIGNEGHEVGTETHIILKEFKNKCLIKVCAYYSQLHWIVDPFHVKGRVDSGQLKIFH